MEPFDFQGKRLEGWTITGTVLSVKKHSRTHVTTSGGGGWVGPNGGTVAPPTVTSSTTTELEIWLRCDGSDGETTIKLFNVEVPLREGQRITLIAAKRPQAKDGFWLTLVNHAANRHWQLSTNVQVSKQGKLDAYPLLRWYDWIVAFLLGWVVLPRVLRYVGGYILPTTMTPTQFVAVLVGPPVLYLVVRLWQRARTRSRIFSALDAWSERNTQAAYTAERTRANGTVAVGSAA